MQLTILRRESNLGGGNSIYGVQGAEDRRDGEGGRGDKFTKTVSSTLVGHKQGNVGPVTRAACEYD